MSAADRAAAFFARYDSFGIRRAGSAGDRASSDWLGDELAGCEGLTLALQDVAFEGFVPGEACLMADDGSCIDGLPLFDGGLTDPAGVTGSIGPLGSDAAIGFSVMAPSIASLPGNAFARARANSRHRALVIALTTRDGGLAPLNAHDLDQPFGPPVLQVAGREAQRLTALGAASARVTVTVTGRREPSASRNLRVELPGERPPIVLLTPRTSWWTSTAERAGGIWAWAETLRALAGAASRRRAVVGLATCGHELGHLGAHHAFAHEPALASASSLVIHLGANLGTATEPALTVRSNVTGTAERMSAILAAEGYPAASITSVTGGKAGGEAHEIEQRGGRYLSLIGDNPWFHAPEDRWPMSIDLARAQIIARSVRALALTEAARASR